MSDVLSDGQDVVVSSFKEGAYNLDAFERLRVSQPRLDFEFNSYHDILFSPLRQFFSNTTSLGATVTHSTTTRSYTLASGVTSGASAVVQQKYYNKYQPARSQVAFLTFLLGSGVANTRKRLGYFDGTDGIYLEQNGTSAPSINLASGITGATLVTVPFASWEQEAQAIDLTKTQILVIDFQWLGVGRVRVGFEINGKFVLATQIDNANINTRLYMASGSLPIRFEITNTGASAGSSFQFYCGAVISEGGNDFIGTFGTTWSARLAAAGRNVGTTEIPLIAIRPKTTFLGETNLTRIIPTDISYFNAGQDSDFAIYYNATVTAGTWVSTDASSAVEFNITGTALTGGRLIASYSADSTIAFSGLTLPGVESLSLDINNAQPTFVLSAVSYSGAANATRGSIIWKEIYR